MEKSYIEVTLGANVRDAVWYLNKHVFKTEKRKTKPILEIVKEEFYDVRNMRITGPTQCSYVFHSKEGENMAIDDKFKSLLENKEVIKVIRTRHVMEKDIYEKVTIVYREYKTDHRRVDNYFKKHR